MSELYTLFEKYKTDKSSKHSYHLIYEPLFSPLKDKEINFLEVGVWKGHSMQAFLEYFPKAQMYGIDIFSRLNIEEVECFGDPRVNLAKCDSTSLKETSKALHDFGVTYDIILDDGAHTPESNKLTFRHCSQYLKSGGMYIIEDVWPLDIMTDKELRHRWLIRHPDRYNGQEHLSFLTELKNSGWTMTRYDNRLFGDPDSYVIALVKP